MKHLPGKDGSHASGNGLWLRIHITEHRPALLLTKLVTPLEDSKGCPTLLPHLNHRVLDEHSTTAEAASTAHHRSRPTATVSSPTHFTAGHTAGLIDIQSNWALRHTQAAAEGWGGRGGNLQVGARRTVVLGLQWEGVGHCVNIR